MEGRHRACILSNIWKARLLSLICPPPPLFRLLLVDTLDSIRHSLDVFVWKGTGTGTRVRYGMGAAGFLMAVTSTSCQSRGNAGLSFMTSYYLPHISNNVIYYQTPKKYTTLDISKCSMSLPHLESRKIQDWSERMVTPSRMQRSPPGEKNGFMGPKWIYYAMLFINITGERDRLK